VALSGLVFEIWARNGTDRQQRADEQLHCPAYMYYFSGLPSWILTCNELKGRWLCLF